MKKTAQLACLAGLFVSILTSTGAVAATYALPTEGSALVGSSRYIPANSGDTLSKIAQHYDVGLNGIVDANGGINPVQPLPHGTKIHIPTAFLLPPGNTRGIIINLPEMRMYYFPPNSKGIVMTYPIGIGKINKTIPIEYTYITRKTLNPTWTPPQDIREFNEKQGITLPKVMPAGPDNPLGPYAIYLKIPTFLIHSTIFPDSVGRRASFGCIRMHEEDIKEFYPLVTAKTPVNIIDLPTKAAWLGTHLYLETHDPLEEHPDQGYQSLVNSVESASHNQTPLVDWQLVSFLAEDRDGLPHDVGFLIS